MRGLASLYKEWQGCLACDLCQTRISVVFGDGSESADIILVGTAPGKNEDIAGLPFCGQAGDILDSLMKDVGLSRNEVFITNIVSCRPYFINEDGKAEDRDPTRQEISACLPRLYEIIRIIDPAIILTLGGVAFQALTGSRTGIMESRGSTYPISVPGITMDLHYGCLPTLHPAALSRNPDMEPGGLFAAVTKDLMKAKKIAKRAKAIRKASKNGKS